MDLLLNMIRGFCMALADSVPGVSGGTIAFVLGFYDEFISSLYVITHGTRQLRREGFKFLCKLGLGWVMGMGSSVLVLASLFTTHIYQLSSLFLGLSLFSLPVIIREEKDCLKRTSRFPFFILGVLLVVVIVWANPTGGQGTNVAINNLSPTLGAYIFGCAMIAICAMVLPGISGSTMLLIFGLYVPIIDAIKEFLHFNLSYFPVLCIFGFGVIAGILGIIRIVKKSLDEHRAAMVYFILGMMIGSFYAIVQGPTTLKVPQPAMTWDTFHLLWFAAGGLLLYGLNVLKNVTEQKLRPEKAGDIAKSEE